MWCVFHSLSSRRITRFLLAFGLLWLLGHHAVLADQSVTLTWFPSTDTNAAGYNIYYGGASGDYTNMLSVGNETAATIFGLSDGTTYYFSATTVTAAGTESPFSNEATYIIPPAATNSVATTNDAPGSAFPPTLDPISNLAIDENAGLQTITLTGISTGSATAATVSVASSDSTIIPAPTVSYVSPAATGTLAFTPVANASGVATITVTVDNGTASNNLVVQTFTVTVTASVAAAPIPLPALDAITNLTVFQNAGTQTVPLTGISSGTSDGSAGITIWAYSSDTTIISSPVVNYTNPAAIGSLAFAPATNALGSATIEVKVNNGMTNFSRFFTVTIVAPPPPPTLNLLPNLVIYQNSGTQTVNLAGITTAGAGPLVISAASSNTNIIPVPAINYASPTATGSLTFPSTSALAGTAAVTVTVTDLSDSSTFSRSFNVTVLPPVPASLAPSLNAISNVAFVVGTASQTVALTGISAGVPASKTPLKITTASSNPRLLPAPVVSYTNSASTAVLTLKPSSNVTGSSTVTVTLNNGAKSNNVVVKTFTVTVTPVPPPTLNPIANVTVVEKAGVQTVELGGISPGSTTSSQSLRVSAVSNNPRLIPSLSVQYASPASNAVLRFIPSATGSGTASITVTVTGTRFGNSVVKSFAVTVAPSAPKILSQTVSAAVSVAAAAASPLARKAPVVDPASQPASLASPLRLNGQFSFQVTGIAGAQYAVQATSDFIHWTSLETNAAPFVFQEPAAGNQRFYRAVYIQGP